MEVRDGRDGLRGEHALGVRGEGLELPQHRRRVRRWWRGRGLLGDRTEAGRDHTADVPGDVRVLDGLVKRQVQQRAQAVQLADRAQHERAAVGRADRADPCGSELVAGTRRRLRDVDGGHSELVDLPAPREARPLSRGRRIQVASGLRFRRFGTALS